MEDRLGKLVELIAMDMDISCAEEVDAILEALMDVSAERWAQEISRAHELRYEREKRRVRVQNARASRRGLRADLTVKEWIETLEHFRWRCAYCQRRFSFDHLEHFFPLKWDQSGTVVDNCVPSCRSCNRAKGITQAKMWIAQLALFPADSPHQHPYKQTVESVYEYLRSRAPVNHRPSL
jgi:5-methylcytosine-specific restriction endonuclease McrA